MHEKDFSTLLGQINSELKEIKATCRLIEGASSDAEVFREKMEAWMTQTGKNNGAKHSDEALYQLQKEAMAHWKKMENALQELRGSTLGLQHSVRQRSTLLQAYLETQEQENSNLLADGIGAGQGPPTQSPKDDIANGRQNDSNYTQVFMVNENQIKTLSTLEGMKEYLTGISQLHGIWLVGAGAGLLLNLALCLAILLRGGDAGAPSSPPGTASPTPAATEREERPLPAEKEAENLPAPPAEVAPPPAQPVSSPSLLSPKLAENLISARAGYALTYLKNQYFSRLAAKYFHPEKGIHFLPEGLRATGHHFAADVVEDAVSAPTTYHWGLSSSDLISMDFQQYYGRYVFDVDYTKEREARYNELSFPGRFGLSADQLAQRFPDCLFAEYHRSGRSLILVFEQWEWDDRWYISAIIHNQ